jgi:hypothetical protein
MTDDKRRATAAELAVEALPLEMPMPHSPSPSAVSGHYWTIDGKLHHDNAEPLELAMAFFRDVWRRQQVRRLVAERGLPAEVVQLAWDALSYESVPFRFGWECWREMRDVRPLRQTADQR